MLFAKDLIAQLNLAEHPEGGWYRETWRADAAPGERASATLIYFLLEAGQSSHWHTVDAAEIWLWHAGNPLELATSKPDSGPDNGHDSGHDSGHDKGRRETILLGPDLTHGHVAQHVIPPGEWQAARPAPGQFDFTLVSCAVSPGFEFAGFTLAPPGWRPDA